MIYIDTSEDEEYFKDPVIPEALAVYLQKAPQFHGQELLYFYHPMGPVVILGHYQDVYHEVNFPYLREHNIGLVRRNPGGGAVFVDPGDLTFVYIDTAQKVKTPKFAHYIQPILAALREVGIDAKQTGRNDLTYQGKKFSGMAFAQIEDRVLYGGTLMFDVNTAMANAVLTPSKSKLADKGIKSVRSRVTNLKPFINRDGFTRDDLQELILKHVQALNPNIQTRRLTTAEWADIKELANKKLGTHQWIYGSGLTDYYVDTYFHGVGSFGLGFNVRDGRLADAKIHGDLITLDQATADQLEKQLTGQPVGRSPLQDTLAQMGLDHLLAAGASAEVAAKIVEAVIDHAH
ncbi:MAG: lipoate--protein ligase [Limosilactobacillus sp.]